MSRQTRSTMSVTRERTVQLPGGDSEVVEDDVQLEIMGVVQQAEPDVGIMCEWVEDLVALDAQGVMVELSRREEEEAQEILVRGLVQDRAEAAAHRRELQQEWLAENAG